jgi:hypothetical protein
LVFSLLFVSVLTTTLKMSYPQAYYPRDYQRGYPREPSRYPPRGYPREPSRYPPRGYPREPSRYPPRDYPSERSRSPPRDYPRERSRSPPRDYQRGHPREHSRSPPRDYPRERSRSPPRDYQRGHPREHSRSPPRDYQRKRDRSPSSDRFRSRSPLRKRARIDTTLERVGFDFDHDQGFRFKENVEPGREFVFDTRNIIHHNGDFTNGALRRTGGINCACDKMINTIKKLRRYTPHKLNFVLPENFVGNRVAHAITSITQFNITVHLAPVYPNCADDAIAYLLAQNRGAVLVSNDRMDKDEDFRARNILRVSRDSYEYQRQYV